MTTTKLNVSKVRDAGSGDFRAVIATVNGREYGCDVYESGEISEWQDGNGLFGNDIATEAEAREAAKNA